MNKKRKHEIQENEDNLVEVELLTQEQLDLIKMQAEKIEYKLPIHYYKLVHNAQEQVGEQDE